MSKNIRPATVSDFDEIWPIFRDIVRAGDSYSYARDTSRSEAEKLWLDLPQKTFVYELDGRVLGTYYLKANQSGAGNHVCNCGYMVAIEAGGQGIATQMCLHSQDIARGLGYRAMQFNFVAETNAGAVALWQKLGYQTVGRLPQAFNHPQQGFVDALIMYKML